ncbi:MAG: NRDE family protein [Betaproteobacteria bacterium]
MCLILVAWKQHSQIPLVVAANRDEFHARPSERAGFWRDQPQILAGRDLEAKGTWLGVSRSGRFAAVTNYRGGRDPDAKESRGALVTRFLLSGLDSTAFMAAAEPSKTGFSGFNLLAADRDQLHWLSNRDGASRKLTPGCHALGNLLLDTPEVADVKARFEGTALAIESLFALLATAKIVAPTYGTRCSTVLLAGADGRTQFAERSFDASGADGSTLRYEFQRAA